MFKTKKPEKPYLYVDDSKFLLERLQQANHPDYLQWVKDGRPTGMHGVQIYANQFEFRPLNMNG